jgi:uncharacterized protein (TIGR02147 family)
LHQDFRQLLRNELESRQERNGGYSLRAYARDLDLSPSRLSEVMNGKQRLSLKSAEKVSNLIGLSDQESKLFKTLVELENPSLTKRQSATKSLSQLNKQLEYFDIDQEAFKIIGSWQHLAILELIECSTIKSITDITESIDVFESEAVAVLERLLSIGLIAKKNSGWKRTNKKLTVNSPVPSRSIRKYHSEMLIKAEKAMFNQKLDQRSFNSVMFSLRGEDVPKAMDKINSFCKDFTAEFSKKTNKNTVYSVNMNMFEITDREKSCTD